MPYRERLIGPTEQASPFYRALQPFGQVPAIEDGDLRLFESGAILLHVAETAPALMPADAAGRARTRAWVFAAVNTVEPAVDAVADLDLFHAGEPWATARRPAAVAHLQKRLEALESWLGGRDHLEDGFTAGDLMMVTVLRILRHTDLVSRRPVLHAYQARCEARPAFKKALADHMRPFATAA